MVCSDIYGYKECYALVYVVIYGHGRYSMVAQYCPRQETEVVRTETKAVDYTTIHGHESFLDKSQ